jgi:hypothetical protein
MATNIVLRVPPEVHATITQAAKEVNKTTQHYVYDVLRLAKPSTCPLPPWHGKPIRRQPKVCTICGGTRHRLSKHYCIECYRTKIKRTQKNA